MVVVAAYFYFELYNENKLLKNDAFGFKQSLLMTKENYMRSKDDNLNLSENLEQERYVNSDLSKNLEEERSRNDQFESQIQNIYGQVGTLQKLSQTDKELLKKYSKVYFLSENYIPSKLTNIDSSYLLNKDETQKLHSDVVPFFVDMMNKAKSDGVDLFVVSAYRSFYDQMYIKIGYKMVYGSGANSFSADQGYSEHQLGTTIDVTTKDIDGLSLEFEKDPAYKWMVNNAHKFGFILSYPKNNSYYQFEPWHWRFVGISLATGLHDQNKSFYDITQREIDGFLIYIFER